MSGAEIAGCILLVDDEENVTAALKRHLRDYRWRVLSARSGAEALAILESHSIDVLVSDERMPEMSGSELLSRARERFPDTARIILSGQADLDAAVRAINEAEVYRFILKPCNVADLIVTIRRALEHKKLMELTRRLLLEYQRKAAVLDRVERANPSLTDFEIDNQGAILIDAEDPAMALELPDLLEQIETQLSEARKRSRYPQAPVGDLP